MYFGEHSRNDYPEKSRECGTVGTRGCGSSPPRAGGGGFWRLELECADKCCHVFGACSQDYWHRPQVENRVARIEPNIASGRRGNRAYGGGARERETGMLRSRL